MTKPHKHAEVLKAIAEGKPVQYFTGAGIYWHDYVPGSGNADPLNQFNFKWRIKPTQAPKTVIDTVKVEGKHYDKYGTCTPYSKSMNMDEKHVLSGDTLSIKVDVYL